MGWVATIFSIGMIHLFGRYIILNIIVAFMKKDIQDSKIRIKKEKVAEKSRADQAAKNLQKQINKMQKK